ncbi:MAG TPA: glycerol-3-phosphate 1-O-acyltransferase PlsY [Sphingomicrobium sp.]|nr:glycerol-3-phosphate 1-O-acyltransferase PlsY [Sphingomicrobium sp.]
MTAELLWGWLIGYLLGSIPFGLLLTRLAGKGDVRKVGSGNIGATNVLRAGGKGLAAATLLLDALKGVAAVLLASLWFGAGAEPFAAAGAMIGHLYPLWLRFRGGKGVATMLGVLIPLLPIAALIYALVWLAMFLAARYSALAGITAAISAPVSAALLGARHLVPMLLGFALLVVWKHRTNIARLRAGTEPRIGKDRG